MYWFGYFMFVLYVRSEDQNPEGRGAWATRPIIHDATCRSFIPGGTHIVLVALVSIVLRLDIP